MTPTPIRSPKQLGAALRTRRKALGLTQTQLGERLSVRQSTISAVEGGEVDTRLSTLLEALGALGLELTLRPRGGGGAATLEELF